MDEFRIAPTVPDNPYRDNPSSGGKNRKRDRHPEHIDQEDIVSLSGQDTTSGDAAEDYYKPSSNFRGEE
jgi:hypothetical protein